MEWTRTYQTQETDSSESSEEKTVLTDIKITTKDDEYIISGKENKKKQPSHLPKSVITV